MMPSPSPLLIESQADEKRDSRRVSVTLTAHCRLGNRHVRDAICDVSRGGLYLKTREPVREGTEVRVAMALPWAEGHRFCTLVGNVARVDRDSRGILRGWGVRIAPQTDSNDRQTLEHFLDGE